MCDKAVNTYLTTVKFVSESYKTQEVCNKTVNRCFFVFDSIPDWYKTQEKCKKVVSADPFLKAPINIKLKECLMKAADDSLAALNVTPDWFVANKMIKKLVMSYFLVTKWVFLVQILITLSLMILIMMNMILKLLFISNFWLGISNLKNVSLLKNN